MCEIVEYGFQLKSKLYTAALQQGFGIKSLTETQEERMKREQMCDRRRAMSGNRWINGNNSASGVSKQ